MVGDISYEKCEAQMYLIFVPDRQDVLPTSDVTFLQVYGWLYKTGDHSKKAVGAGHSTVINVKLCSGCRYKGKADAGRKHHTLPVHVP